MPGMFSYSYRPKGLRSTLFLKTRPNLGHGEEVTVQRIDVEDGTGEVTAFRDLVVKDRRIIGDI